MQYIFICFRYKNYMQLNVHIKYTFIEFWDMHTPLWSNGLIRYRHHPRKFSHISSTLIPASLTHQKQPLFCFVFPLQIRFSALELEINEIIQCVSLCVWILSLSIMYLRRTYIVGIAICISDSFLLLSCSLFYDCRMFIHSPIDGHLDCFPFLANMSKVKPLSRDEEGSSSTTAS